MKHQQEEGPLEGPDRVALLPEQLFLVLSLVQTREVWHLGYPEEVKNQTARTRGNQPNSRIETSTERRSSARTRQGGIAVPSAVIANHEGGMLIASSITTSPSNRTGNG